VIRNPRAVEAKQVVMMKIYLLQGKRFPESIVILINIGVIATWNCTNRLNTFKIPTTYGLRFINLSRYLHFHK